MKIILIGNYKKDRQESMARFAQMLHSGFVHSGFETEIWYPIVFFAYFFKRTNYGLGKWIAYIDKWILFPIILKVRLLFVRKKRQNIRIHICDHSNAIYLAFLSNNYSSITCHDVLAIRAGLGFDDASCTASSTGKILQRLILKNLLSADKLASVSRFTLDQLEDLSLSNKVSMKDKNWMIIYNAFNAEFTLLEKEKTDALLNEAGVSIASPFILHIGSSLARKNRSMLLKMVAFLGDKWTGNICFAGQPIDRDLKKMIDLYNLNNRVFSVVSPRHEVLNSLYNSCYAFIFPSFSEGFGWPVIEAQACRAPVIASSIAPMPEIGGEGALYANPYNTEEFAQALLLLNQDDLKNNIINKGVKNIERFNFSEMIDLYIKLMEIR